MTLNFSDVIIFYGVFLLPGKVAPFLGAVVGPWEA